MLACVIDIKSRLFDFSSKTELSIERLKTKRRKRKQNGMYNLKVSGLC